MAQGRLRMAWGRLRMAKGRLRMAPAVVCLQMARGRPRMAQGRWRMATRRPGGQRRKVGQIGFDRGRPGLDPLVGRSTPVRGKACF